MQADFNSFLVAASLASLAVNAFFLRGIAADLRAMRAEQQQHGERLSWIEGRILGHPRRRREENSGGHYPQTEGM